MGGLHLGCLIWEKYLDFQGSWAAQLSLRQIAFFFFFFPFTYTSQKQLEYQRNKSIKVWTVRSNFMHIGF